MPELPPPPPPPPPSAGPGSRGGAAPRLLVAVGPAGGWVEPDELDLLAAHGFEACESRCDLGGHERVSLGRLA